MKTKKHLFNILLGLALVMGLMLGMSLTAMAETTLSGSGTKSAPYIIASAEDWNNLADNVNEGIDYSGKFFKLTNDITVSRMIGVNNHASSSYPQTNQKSFSGTFDGGGKILTLAINSTNTHGAAPFSATKNATIKNLNVTGSVVGGIHSAGLVGVPNETLNVENCNVSVAVSGSSHLGGFVGHAFDATVNLSGCTFNGSLTGSSNLGGMIGWSGLSYSLRPTITINNCLFSGTYANGNFHPVGYSATSGDSATLTDFYTTKAASGTTSNQLIINGTINTAFPVIYKVTNGTWSDKTSTDKTEIVHSGSTPANVPTGMKPAEGYTGGAWNTDPTTATITEATTFTYTFEAKNTQTINASDVTAIYGDTDKKVEATTDGNGAISYAVKEGSADYIDVNSATGALTIKKVPSDGKAYVTVTAAGTATYEQAIKEVTVTINKAAPTVTAPTAKTLTYTGTAQELVNAGSATGGTMYYAVTTENTAPTDDNLYTASIPTKTDAGTYYVWYKVVGDSTHTDSTPACVTVTIGEKIVYTAVETSATVAEHTIGSGQDAVLVFHRSVDDANTINHFASAAVDGKTLSTREYTVKSGSLILTLKASYLDTLTPGAHRVTATFDDGTADTMIQILEAPPTPAPTNVPKTGDGANLGLWLTLMLSGLLLLGGWSVYTIRKRN